MPTIFDNINKFLGEELTTNLEDAERADFCIGYFNLRGWSQLSDYVDELSGDGTDNPECRILLGMYGSKEREIKELYSKQDRTKIDNKRAVELKKKLARNLREQLTYGIPTRKDEINLQKLAGQLCAGKICVKLYTRTSLHAKLYLIYDNKQKKTKKVGYLGSSNLTFSGLGNKGELNIDVLDQDAANKLKKWFQDRWQDQFSIDITKELIEILEESWASEKLLPPYLIYLKIAYHLSREARAGIKEFKINEDIRKTLFPFQREAVSIAARHLQKRNGVMIGDVVGLGKTYTACALAHMFEEDHFHRTLIICPANLEKMWKSYKYQFNLRAQVLKITQVQQKLKDLKRYNLIIIDESHNLRNRDGKRYGAIKDYISQNDAKVILLTATPYNKTLLDLSSQLSLFIDDDDDLGIAPENYISSIGGEDEYIYKHQGHIRSIKAFEKSDYIEDWQDLMKHYLVRRTRTFIKNNYAEQDEDGRYYLVYENGQRAYFPERIAKKFEYNFNPSDPNDQYAKLYSEEIVTLINDLELPRYGLKIELKEDIDDELTDKEKQIEENLSRAGKRLMGFCRTNLFKRLESSGHAFLLSVARHIYRNYVYLHAIENGKPIPIGSQEASLIDTFLGDTDLEETDAEIELITEEETYKTQAAKTYDLISIKSPHRYKWIRSELFADSLRKKLQQDCEKLLRILEIGKTWPAEKDRQLNAVLDFCIKKYPEEKILIFTQYSDTAYYIHEYLKPCINRIQCVTGDTDDPTSLAQKFSPKSNNLNIPEKDQIRVLISTDVLSEGQNLQDGRIIINYDLPWALIRLIQRAGRIDRIGQKAKAIYCYSILPEDGVNKIISLRDRLEERIQENAEVVGSDETFFEGDPVMVQSLYNEKSGLLENEDDEEVDLSSYAYEIWNKATKENEELKEKVTNLPNVVYATKKNPSKNKQDVGVLTYAKTRQDHDLLTWVNQKKEIVTQSQYKILKAAECDPNADALEPRQDHHKLVGAGIEHLQDEAKRIGGQLGGKRSIRYKVYKQLERYQIDTKQSLFDIQELNKAVDQIYAYPLLEFAKDRLSRSIRNGDNDQELAELVLSLYENKDLCLLDEDEREDDKSPKIICSLGLKN
jgi:superfamily II DNA or RNA helicase